MFQASPAHTPNYRMLQLLCTYSPL